MKYASAALLALLSTSEAVKLTYDESEGPTMPDYGESDPHVLEREGDIKNGEKESGWTNPLGWADNGEDDESVLPQTRSRIRMRYDESEGPTMPDYGESDPHVLEREGDIKNGEKAGGWTNPLGWSDDGEGDESVITQLKADIRMNKSHKTSDEYDNDENTVSVYDAMEHHKKFDWGWTKPADFEGAMLKRKAHARDAYDHDENTASVYDDMPKHQKFDWGLPPSPAEFEGAQLKKHRSAHKRDAYDGDEDTASIYDEMTHHKKFDFGVKAGEHGALKPEAFAQKHHRHHHRRHHH